MCILDRVREFRCARNKCSPIFLLTVPRLVVSKISVTGLFIFIFEFVVVLCNNLQQKVIEKHAKQLINELTYMFNFHQLRIISILTKHAWCIQFYSESYIRETTSSDIIKIIVWPSDNFVIIHFFWQNWTIARRLTALRARTYNDFSTWRNHSRKLILNFTQNRCLITIVLIITNVYCFSIYKHILKIRKYTL